MYRHIYIKWLEPKTSVLDKYNDDIENKIEKSQSIEALLSIYDKTREDIKSYESTPGNPKVPEDEKTDTEPYKSERKVRNSIEEWESHEKDIHKLRFFWICGFASVIIGFVFYARIDQWIGIVGVITGFSEMIFWTCPKILGFFGARSEFERLIDNKILFSIATWFLLIAAWFLLYKIKGKSKEAV
jgi:hypothetical protein